MIIGFLINGRLHLDKENVLLLSHISVSNMAILIVCPFYRSRSDLEKHLRGHAQDSASTVTATAVPQPAAMQIGTLQILQSPPHPTPQSQQVGFLLLSVRPSYLSFFISVSYFICIPFFLYRGCCPASQRKI